MKRLTFVAFAFGIAVCLSLLVLSGCDDPAAQSSAAAANAEVNNLKAKLAGLAEKEEIIKELKVVREDLATKIDTKMSQISDQLTEKIKEAMVQMLKDSDESRTAAKNMIKDSRDEVDKQLKTAKSDTDALVMSIREDIKKSNEELKKFMDNQLRELYPYAYQPRRLEPNAPPPAEAK